MKKILALIMLFTLCVYIYSEPHLADEKLPAGPKPKDRPSVALVLAGGGAKGFAHLPVIELIEKMDIPIDMIVGTSIGSIIGGLYSAGYTTSEIDKSFQNVDWTPIFADTAFSPYENTLMEHSLFKNLITLNLGLDLSLKLGKGVSNGQKIYEMIKERTLKYPSDMDFNKLPVPFRAVVCDMLTGEALVLDEGDLAEAIRASMSLPSVFEPMEIDGKYYMDGGIRYNLAINVAKNMGYDIIIAIDISQKVRDDPDVFSSNPAIAMLNTITIAQYTATQSMYKDADLVILPELADFGTLDFKKSSLIYEEGKKTVTKYTQALEDIRKKIYPKDYDSSGKRISKYKILPEYSEYDSKPLPVISSINTEGLFPVDQKYIKLQSEKIKGIEFTPQVFSDFMESLKLTGNYKSIKARIYSTDSGTELFLKMTQEESKSAKLCLDIDYTQVISTRTTSMLDFSLGVQYRGLTGRGSVISMRAKSVNDFGLSLYYLQPINTNLFCDLNLNLEDRRYPQLPFGSLPKDMSEYNSFKEFNAVLSLGARTDTGRTIRLGGFYKYISSRDLPEINYFKEYFIEPYETAYEIGNNDKLELLQSLFEEYYETTSNAKSSGIFVNYEINRLDSQLFPHKGVSYNLNAKYAFSFDENWNSKPHMLILTSQGKSVIPFGRHVSMNSTTLIGTDIFGNMASSPASMFAEGFTNFNRIYFPQICSPTTFGSCILASALTFQIEPWKQLTILGGDLILTLNGTVGNVTETFTEMIPSDSEENETNPILWTGGAGIALKIKSAYSIYIRFGAASTMQKSVTPFFSLDIGSINF